MSERPEKWKVLCYTVPDYRKKATEELDALIRAAESSAMERAAQVMNCDPRDTISREVAKWLIIMQKRIRALIPPAAAPAAETASYDEQRRLSTFDAQLAKAGCAPAAETGKAQGVEAYRIENLRASLAAAGKRIEELEALVGRCEEALLVPDARKERKLLADLALDRNKPRAAPPEREGK